MDSILNSKSMCFSFFSSLFFLFDLPSRTLPLTLARENSLLPHLRLNFLTNKLILTEQQKIVFGSLSLFPLQVVQPSYIECELENPAIP